jgi:hypothetical protein
VPEFEDCWIVVLLVVADGFDKGWVLKEVEAVAAGTGTVLRVDNGGVTFTVTAD